MKARLLYVCASYTVKIKVAFIIHLLFLYIEKYISRILLGEYRNTENALFITLGNSNVDECVCFG